MQKKDLSKLVLTTLLTGSVLWGGTAFAAEENLQEFSLDTMVVTATRTEMSVKEAPSAVQVVDSKKLEQTQAKTLHDALKGALGVNVFNDFQGRSNVSIRGSKACSGSFVSTGFLSPFSGTWRPGVRVGVDSSPSGELLSTSWPPQ